VDRSWLGNAAGKGFRQADKLPDFPDFFRKWFVPRELALRCTALSSTLCAEGPRFRVFVLRRYPPSDTLSAALPLL
jgi:hypothetical protein